MGRLLPVVVVYLLAIGAYGWAPHPSVLTVAYQGRLLPVITVVDHSPVVQVDGREVIISEPPIYRIERADQFSDAAVKLVRSGAYTAIVRPITFPLRFNGIRAVMELRAEHGLKGGFAIVIVFNLNLETREPVLQQLVVQGLPDLPAGENVPVKIVAPGPFPDDVQYFAQIFDNTGHEVKTSVMSLAWDYFARVEKAQFKRALETYLNAHRDEDRAVLPFLKPKPEFDVGIPAPASACSATLKVSADGLVKGVELSAELDAETRRCIYDALYGWLFYPQLKAGTPMPTEVTVQLEF